MLSQTTKLIHPFLPKDIFTHLLQEFVSIQHYTVLCLVSKEFNVIVKSMYALLLEKQDEENKLLLSSLNDSQDNILFCNKTRQLMQNLNHFIISKMSPTAENLKRYLNNHKMLWECLDTFNNKNTNSSPSYNMSFFSITFTKKALAITYLADMKKFIDEISKMAVSDIDKKYMLAFNEYLEKLHSQFTCTTKEIKFKR